VLPIYLGEKAKARHISSTQGRKFLGFSQTLLTYSFKVNEKKKKKSSKCWCLWWCITTRYRGWLPALRRGGRCSDCRSESWPRFPRGP